MGWGQRRGLRRGHPPPRVRAGWLRRVRTWQTVYNYCCAIMGTKGVQGLDRASESKAVHVASHAHTG